MKKVKDKFSERYEFYKKFRPKYPQELYHEILKFYIFMKIGKIEN